MSTIKPPHDIFVSASHRRKILGLAAKCELQKSYEEVGLAIQFEFPQKPRWVAQGVGGGESHGYFPAMV